MHHISPAQLSIERIEQIIQNNEPITLSPEAALRIRLCRRYLEDKLMANDRLYYGINTGFGSLCNVRISDDDIENLQNNLVKSHAVGTGDEVPLEILRIMMLLKIQSLSYGHSGVRIELVQRLIDFYNAGIFPVVYELGSLGASGDLAPLAHLSLPLIGLGEVWYEGKKQKSADVLSKCHWKPLTFKAKEALSLLNGTQFSAAYAVWCTIKAKRLADIADMNAAIGYDAFNCQLSPLQAQIHQVRPYKGQRHVAQSLLRWLEGSSIAQSEKTSVQDPYAFRCVPQVHGASRDALEHVADMLTIELNSVTDNPNIFPDDDLIVSGGNFHGQPLALPLDYLSIALSEWGNISERRIYQLISGLRGLPSFLTDNPGLHSGMMIAQYTAAAIVNQNKTLCSPASVDSIVSCNGQEDHVSMAANAATKAQRVVQNLERLLAIELMVAVQALEYRLPLRSSPAIENVRAAYRAKVPRLGLDRVLSEDLAKSIEFLREFK